MAFAYVKDVVTLLAAKDLGVLDKAEKDTLVAFLSVASAVPPTVRLTLR